MSDEIVVPKLARLQAMKVKVPGWLRTHDLHLYQNDYTPDVDSDVGDFVECDFPGYTFQDVTDFGDPYINTDKEAESDSEVHTWLCDDTPDPSPQSVYGWYMTGPDDDIGPCARFADGPIDLTGPGQSIAVQIFFEDGALEEE